MELLDATALKTAYGEQLSDKIQKKLSFYNEQFRKVHDELGDVKNDSLTLPANAGFEILNVRSESITSADRCVKPFEAHAQANLHGVVLACEFDIEKPTPSSYLIGLSSFRRRLELLATQAPKSIIAAAAAQPHISLIDTDNKQYSPFHVIWAPKLCIWLKPSLEDLRANCVNVVHKTEDEEKQFVLLPALHPVVRYFYESISRAGINKLVEDGYITSVRSFVQDFKPHDETFITRMPLNAFEVVCERMHKLFNVDMPPLERLGDVAVSLFPKKDDDKAPIKINSVRLLFMTRTVNSEKPFILSIQNAGYFQCVKTAAEQLRFYDCLNECVAVAHSARCFYYGCQLEPQRIKRAEYIQTEQYKAALYVKDAHLLNNQLL